MKPAFFLTVTIALCSSLASAHNFTMEAAGGVGSPHTPFSSKWNGSVSANGLLFREFAFRSSYQFRNLLSASGTLGWIKSSDASETGRVYFSGVPPIPPYGYHFTQPLQEVTYFIPSVLFSFETIRVNLGTIIYSTSQTSGEYHEFGYPFDGGHRFRPVIGFELGEQSGYIFMHFLDTFPLYSGGVTQVGIGGRVNGIYEHRAFLIGPPFGIVGLGYRGEFRVYHSTAISIGLSAGGTDKDNIFLMSLGLKTII